MSHYEYKGLMVVRPLERGTMLMGLEDQLGIEQWLPEGVYEVVLVARKIEKEKK